MYLLIYGVHRLSLSAAQYQTNKQTTSTTKVTSTHYRETLTQMHIIHMHAFALHLNGTSTGPKLVLTAAAFPPQEPAQQRRVMNGLPCGQCFNAREDTRSKGRRQEGN